MTAIKWNGNLTKHFTADEYVIGNSPKATLTIDMRAMAFARLLEKFRVWLDRPMIINSWKRSEALNREVGGIASSNHLKGTAADWHTNIPITEALFIKWAKKWKKICKASGLVGEAGFYPWGIHFGIQSEAQIKANGGRFVNWKTIYVTDPKTGKKIAKQTTGYYNI